MKIVILDGYTENPGDLSWEGLEKLGDLAVYDRTSLTDVQEAIGRVGDAEIVFTNKTPMPREVFETCTNIRYVGVLATGYNVVDVDAAKDSGVQHTDLRNRSRGTVRYCTAAGNLPSRGTS